tara:strand:- start:493 stop:846 length:354 start_codon:yes stop_codon:yes gene_type:complete
MKNKYNKFFEKELREHKGETSDIEIQEIKNESEQGEWRQVYEKDENGVIIGGAYEYKWFPKPIEKPNMSIWRGTTGYHLRGITKVKLSEHGKVKKFRVNISLPDLKKVISELEEGGE